MAASARMTRRLEHNEISLKGEIYLSVLREVARNLNKEREDNGLEPIKTKDKYRDQLYNLLKDYVEFQNEDGSEYTEQEKSGSGKPLVEIVEQTELVVPFNDVRNDPYFIVK